MDKKFRIAYAKAINADDKVIEAHVSTFDWDRTNERFVKGAWDLKNFEKNPVVLWAHEHREPPIAKATKIFEDEVGLFAKMEFDEKSEFAMQIFSMFQRGFLHSFSVGFNPRNFIVEPIEGTEKKGIVWTDAELLEFSAVPIPAQPGAVVSREQAELITKALGDRFIRPGGDAESFVFVEPKESDSEEKDKKQFEVQTLIFPKKHWDREGAVKWSKDHDFRSDKVDETEDSFRLRQKEPGEFQRLRTICINPNQETEPDSDECKVKAVGGPLKKEVEQTDHIVELETSLKGLIDLAKVCKNQKLDDGRIALVKSSMTILQEIITENSTSAISRKEFDELKSIVEQCAQHIQGRYPDASELVSKFMSQINAALRGYKAK